MSFDRVIMWVMAVGALLGALDRIFGNRLGLGEKFEEGFQAMGPLALGMTGMICLTPVLAQVLRPVIVPFFQALGADPAMFGALLANDMGGYSLAMELAGSKEAGQLAGAIVASMLGCTLIFSIPVGLGLIEKEDAPYFSKGLLLGMVTIPVGDIVGGLAAGFPVGMVMQNILPVLIFAALLAVGILLAPQAMVRGCLIFGKLIGMIITAALGAAAFTSLTGVTLIPGMADIREGLAPVMEIGIVLLGTFPVLSLLIKLLNKPLSAVGKKLGLDKTSTAGVIFSLATSVPVYPMMKQMNKKGIIVNTAWLVPATATFGDHLGFTAGVCPEMVGPMVAGKLAAGVLAVVLALLYCRKMEKTEEMELTEQGEQAVEVKQQEQQPAGLQ